MITSHVHQPSHIPNSTDLTSLDTMTSSAAISGQGGQHAGSAGDPFTSADATADSPAQFEDDFDIPPISLPPSALEDQHQQPDYNNGASYQHYQQSQQHQQQQMYPQQQQHYQQQQQQHWVNNQYMNNGYNPPQYNEYNNGSTGYGYNMHYQQQQQQPIGGVAMGGPSPGGGSHNTPSPTGHSDDGDQEVRNNNVLKQPQSPYIQGSGAAVSPPGGPVVGPPVAGHPYAHAGHPYGGVGPHGTPHHHHGHPMHHHHHHVNVMPKKPKGGHMHNGIMSGPPQQGHPQVAQQQTPAQMHGPHGGPMGGGVPPMHPPQASPLDSQGGHSPTSSNTSQTPQTTPTSVSGSGQNPNNSRDVPKICGRPGCNNPVQRSPDGWQSDFCSNECVVGQCKEVYTNWSSSSSTGAGPHPGGPPPGGPYMSQHPVQPHPHQQQQQQQQQTAVVK